VSASAWFNFSTACAHAISESAIGILTLIRF
jgi:hypothetical protein